MNPRRVAAFPGIRVLNESGPAQVGLELANLARQARPLRVSRGAAISAPAIIRHTCHSAGDNTLASLPRGGCATSDNVSADLRALSIRLAHAADTDAVRALVNEAYGHYVARIGKPPAVMFDDYARRIASNQAWAWEEDHSIVGLLVLVEKPAHLLLDNVAVAPTAQGRGIGRALIAFAEAEGRRRCFEEIQLYTHALMIENIALYARLGFTETRRLQEQGYDRVSMAKPLREKPAPDAR